MKRTIAWFLVSLALVVPSVAAAQDSSKVPLTIADYGSWRSLGSTTIAERGDWVAFSYRQREKDDVLHVRQLDAEEGKEAKRYEIERGSSPVFSDDSRWVIYYLSPSVKEKEKLEKEKKPVRRQAELLELATGTKTSWDNVRSVAFSRGSQLLAIHKVKQQKDVEHDGTNLLLRRLADGSEELLGSVASFAFNKPGTHLAYAIDAVDQEGNGVVLFDVATSARRSLHQAEADYARLTWSEEGTALAVLAGEEKEGYEEHENELHAWTGLGTEEVTSASLDAKETFGFPKDRVISEKADLSWAEPPTRLFFGIKQQVKKPEKKSGKDEDGASKDKVADVDIWHWRDEQLQSVQMVRASRDRNRTDRAVFHVGGDQPFVRLTDDAMRSVELSRDGRWGVGRDQRAYVSDWRQSRSDFYRVDVETGEREQFLVEHQRALGLSADGTHYAYWKDGHVWAVDLASLEHRNLTEKAPVSFVNEEFDRVGEKPPYGIAGWTADGEAVVLEHRYDLWLQPADGSPATNLTGGYGTEHELRLRYVRIDPEERTLDLDGEWLLSAYGQWTKRSGFFRWKGGELEEQIYLDRRFGRVTKARHADRYLYTIESFEEFPDLHVSDGSFRPRRLSDTNPQQVGFRWGHRILFDYENEDGVRLQGTLGIPERFVEGQRLPMLVNFYEKNSQNLHRYPTPRYSSGPQFAGYLSAGYLVMQPDVHFRTGRSHSDMLECVEAAVAKCVEMGYADPERVGLHGHSYSGQGAAYIATRSKMFAAVVAGAAATNLVSDFNQLWKSAGTNQHRYDIHGQGRFGTNPYDDIELYRDQSAVTFAREMDIPLLQLHGTDDGSVEWLQAVELYNALRFNGKNVILLSYPGEGHGLRKHENRVDFQTRMRAFFDHHLRDKAAPEWMIRGQTFLEKERRLKASGD